MPGLIPNPLPSFPSAEEQCKYVILKALRDEACAGFGNIMVAFEIPERIQEELTASGYSLRQVPDLFGSVWVIEWARRPPKIEEETCQAAEDDPDQE